MQNIIQTLLRLANLQKTAHTVDLKIQIAFGETQAS